MEHNAHSKPPRWAMTFFRWFCHPAHREELEGDLLEQFAQNVRVSGVRKARWRFAREVFLLLRRSVIFNRGSVSCYHVPDRMRRQWIKIGLLNLLFALLVLIPFMPGPFTKPMAVFSLLGRWMGFFGTLLVPVAIIWLIREIRSSLRPPQVLNNWTSGYYFSLIALFLGSVIASFILFLLAHEYGAPAVKMGLLCFLLLFTFAVRGIRRLRRPRHVSFNFTPLYLLTIPIVVIIMQLYVVLPVSHYSRQYIIAKSQSIIEAIENYKTENGHYPESLNALSGPYWSSIPRPGTMGVPEFRYEKVFNDYNLYFVQWQHFGATREVVIYNKNENYNMQGHFASFDAGEKHWKYYWLD